MSRFKLKNLRETEGGLLCERFCVRLGYVIQNLKTADTFFVQQYRGESDTFLIPLDPSSYIPDNASGYWRYIGKAELESSAPQPSVYRKLDEERVEDLLRDDISKLDAENTKLRELANLSKDYFMYMLENYEPALFTSKESYDNHNNVGKRISDLRTELGLD